jgi:hypothetical protein
MTESICPEKSKHRKRLPVANTTSEPVIVKLLMSPGIDSQPGGIDCLESIYGLLNVYKFGLCFLAIFSS